MAWEYWQKSGRVDSYRFDVLPLSSVNAKRTGTLDCVTQCSLTFDWETDSRVSGSMTIRDKKRLDGCYVRVWYVPTVDGERKSVELATMYAFTQSASYKDGYWTSNVTLESVLTRYTRDKLHKNWALNANTSALAAFRSAMKEFGGSYVINGVPDVKFSKTTVVEFGESVFSLFAKIAKTLGCAVSCDSHGRVVLDPIKYASTRNVSGTVTTGNSGVMLPDVSFSSTWQTTPNRYATHYVKDDVHLFGKATVDASKRNHPSSIGRYITACEELDSLSPMTQAAIDAKTKSGMNAATTAGADVYTFKTLYLPLELNRVYWIKPLGIDGIVKSMDVDLGSSMMLKVSVRKVRSHG